MVRIDFYTSHYKQTGKKIKFAYFNDNPYNFYYNSNAKSYVQVKKDFVGNLSHTFHDINLFPHFVINTFYFALMCKVAILCHFTTAISTTTTCTVDYSPGGMNSYKYAQGTPADK